MPGAHLLPGLLVNRLHRLTGRARLELLRIDRAKRELGVLQTLEKLPALPQQQGFQRQRRLMVQVQFETVAMLILGANNQRFRRSAGHTRIADQMKVIPLRESRNVERLVRPGLPTRHLGRKLGAGTTDVSIDQQYLRWRAIQLQQTLPGVLSFRDLPDGMSRKAAVALVDECTGIALAIFCCHEAIHPGFGISSEGRH